MKYLYPGSSIMVKRIKHGFVLSAITLTVWINGLQDQMIQTTTMLMKDTQTYLPSVQSQVKMVETIIPVLERLDDTQFGYLIEGTGLPTASEMRRHCDAVRHVGAVIPRMSPMLSLTGYVLKYTSIFLAFQIAFSLFWLGMDLRRGDQKILTIGLIVIAIGINYAVHGALHGMKLLT